MDSLPSELLHYICEQLDDNGLANIANTCRRLYSIANKLLYTDIDVGLAPLSLLLRTVVENKELAAKVKRIKFSEIWTVEAVQRDIVESGLRQVPQPFRELLEQALSKGDAEAQPLVLLCLLPGLEGICLDFELYDERSDDEWENDEPTGFLRYPLLLQLLQWDTSAEISASDPIVPLCSLRFLDIASPYDMPWTIKSSFPKCEFWSVDSVERLWTRKNLRHLSLSRCTTEFSVSITALEPLPRSSDLESLSITDSIIDASYLDRILRSIRALKHFQYQVTQPTQIFYHDNILASNVSPAQLLKGLVHHKSTLRTLDFATITLNTHWDINQGDETPHGYSIGPYRVTQLHKDGGAIGNFNDDYDDELDEDDDAHETVRLQRCKEAKRDLIQPISSLLKEFTVLEDLSITATDLLGPMEHAAPTSWQPLRELLPPSLRRLCLRYSYYFDDQAPQFADNWDCDRPNQDWHRSYMGHIVELLLDKELLFPHLTEIYLELLDEGLEIPDDIMEIAKKVGVNIMSTYVQHEFEITSPYNFGDFGWRVSDI